MVRIINSICCVLIVIMVNRKFKILVNYLLDDFKWNLIPKLNKIIQFDFDLEFWSSTWNSNINLTLNLKYENIKILFSE